MLRCCGRWIVAARLPGPRATASRAGEDRRRCDIELPRAGEGCVGEKPSATSAGSSPRDRSIARRRAMIRFSFSSAPALPDQEPKRACFIGARRPPCRPADQSSALSIDGMQLGWPARTNNGHPGSCDEAGIPDPRARAALPLLLLLRPCAEARRWLVRKARAKPRNDLHVRAGGVETQNARGFSGHGRHFAYIGNRQNRQESVGFYLTPSLRTFGFD